MKFGICALVFMIHAFLGTGNADEKISFYIECSPGQRCIDLAYENGKRESVLAAPVLELAKADIQSANVQWTGYAPRSLNIELSKEASKKFEEITAEHIGEKLIVVLNNKILTAPTINARVSSRTIMISGEEGPFWEYTPWLQEVLSYSQGVSRRRSVIYVTIALVILIASTVYILWPRMKQGRSPGL